MEGNKHVFDREHLVGSARDLGGRGFHAGLSTLGDFQKFLLRGNVIDLAVGVVIGTAFNAVVLALVKDFITPLIGLIGVKDFSTGYFTLGQNKFMYGDFINVLISFILIAAVVYFFVVKPFNILQDRYNHLRPKPAEAPKTHECPFCLSTVNIKATRCAYCTAQLPPAEQASAMQPAQG